MKTKDPESKKPEPAPEPDVDDDQDDEDDAPEPDVDDDQDDEDDAPDRPAPKSFRAEHPPAKRRRKPAREQQVEEDQLAGYRPPFRLW